MSSILVENDPQKRADLIAERKDLLEFIESKGFKAGLKVVTSTFDDAIEVILNSNPEHEGLRNQAIGEARLARNFKKLYTDRLAELNDAIGTLSEDEQT